MVQKVTAVFSIELELKPMTERKGRTSVKLGLVVRLYSPARRLFANVVTLKASGEKDRELFRAFNSVCAKQAGRKTCTFATEPPRGTTAWKRWNENVCYLINKDWKLRQPLDQERRSAESCVRRSATVRRFLSRRNPVTLHSAGNSRIYMMYRGAIWTERHLTCVEEFRDAIDARYFGSGCMRNRVRTPVPEHVRIAVWRRDAGRCARCGSRVRLEFDHIVPISRGGSNTARNIELLCQDCNRSKGSRIR